MGLLLPLAFSIFTNDRRANCTITGATTMRGGVTFMKNTRVVFVKRDKSTIGRELRFSREIRRRVLLPDVLPSFAISQSNKELPTV